MLQYVSKGEHDDKWYFSAYDQCWDDATLKELWDEHNIIFMPDGIDAVHAVMIVKREGERPLIAIGVEDDGTLYFDRRYGFFKHAFDSYWIDSLVKTLLEAKAKINGDWLRGHRIENPLTDLPLVLPGEVLTTSETEAIIKPIEEESDESRL